MKKAITILFQLTFFVFASIAGAENVKLNSPFAWSVEKDGKTHYILGTLHGGVSLEKDVTCSDKIIEQIEKSDLVFLESSIISVFAQLSEEDRVALFTGSKEEREEVMNRFAPEIQQTIIERKQTAKQMIMKLFPFQAIYEGNESFKDLSENTKEFLISHGADTQGNYGDYFYFIYEILYYKAFFAIDDGIDLQVAKIAQSNEIKIKALDDNSNITHDLRAENSKKPMAPVSRVDIEVLVEIFNQIFENFKQSLLQKRQPYISGDREVFKSIEIGSKKALLKNRNESWLKKFTEAHANPKHNSIFLAGGTSHFVGSFNLIDWLKEEGFSINPITCPID